MVSQRAGEDNGMQTELATNCAARFLRGWSFPHSKSKGEFGKCVCQLWEAFWGSRGEEVGSCFERGCKPVRMALAKGRTPVIHYLAQSIVIRAVDNFMKFFKKLL